MKSLNEIYRDSFDRKNKWYHIVWFYIAMAAIIISLTPAAIWRNTIGKSNDK